MIPDHERHITPTEAFRAIYLDLEGLVKEPPALLGWACEFDFEQVVLDVQLELPARGKRLSVRSLSKAVGELLDRCRQEDRVLIGYSQSEKHMIADATAFTADDIYRDAKAIAKRWINRLHPDAKSGWDEWKLRYLLEYMGFPWPSHLGYKKATKKIRTVRDRADGKESYEEIARGGKKHWTNLLYYNRIDTLGMRDLTMRAAAELAVAEEHGIFAEAS